jgi:HlyD family secretion protein
MKPYALLLLLLITSCQKNAPSLALGTLERDRIAHTATVSEVVIALPIAAGHLVKKGDVLVELDKTLQMAQVDHAEAELLKAQAYLDKLQNGARPEEVARASAQVTGAKAALLESEINYQRLQDLAKNNLASQAELTKSIAIRDENIANLKSAQQTLKQLTNGTRFEDLAIGEAQLAAAQAVLASENKKLKDLTITATRDGILDNLPWNLGERVTMGSPLAIVLAGKAPYARVYVPETSRVKIKVGQTLTIRIDGLMQNIKGKVRWIANEPAFSPYYALNQTDRARLMYLTEVQLPDTQQALPNGLPVQVELP